MFAKVFVLALLAIACSATPTSQDTGLASYGEAIDLYYQAWKKMLPCGYAPYKIPPLAPYTLDFLPFEYKNGVTDLKGNVSNIRITGLQNFDVLSGSFDEDTQRATFDIMYPEIQILGSYELEGTLGIGGLPVPIRQSVLINKKVMDWRFVGDYSFAQSESNSDGLRIADINLHYYIGDLKLDMWDKYMDIAANNFRNKFLRSATLLFSEEIQPYVSELYAKFILPMSNKQLENVNMAQLNNFLLAQSELWSNVKC